MISSPRMPPLLHPLPVSNASDAPPAARVSLRAITPNPTMRGNSPKLYASRNHRKRRKWYRRLCSNLRRLWMASRGCRIWKSTRRDRAGGIEREVRREKGGLKRGRMAIVLKRWYVMMGSLMRGSLKMMSAAMPLQKTL